MIELGALREDMLSEFQSYPALVDYFKDEKTCFEYLVYHRWKGGNPVCPFCRSEHVYIGKSRSRQASKREVPEYQCADKGCAKVFTATTKTIFEGTKLPLRTWYQAMYLIGEMAFSSVKIAKFLKVTQKTAWFLDHRIREIMKDPNPQPLAGITEADETYVGGKNKNRHKSKKKGKRGKLTVLGLKQREGKVRAFTIPRPSSEIIHPLIQEHVEIGTTFITDAHPSYRGLDVDYRHVVVKSTEKYRYAGAKKMDPINNTNGIENFWSVLRRGIHGTYRLMTYKHMQRYNEEYCFRQNFRGETTSDRFRLALGWAVNRRLKYKDLIAKDKEEYHDNVANSYRETDNGLADWDDAIDPNNAPIVE